MIDLAPTTVKIIAVTVVVVLITLRYYLTKVQSMSSFFRSIYSLIEPYLYISGTAVSNILARCNWTTDSYTPIPWFLRGASHTISAINRGAALPGSLFEREILMAANASTIAIDWFDHPEDMVKKYQGLLVIFNHGLNGGLSQGLIKSALSAAHPFKLGVCVVNLQGVCEVGMSSTSIGVGLSFILEYKSVTERIHQHVGASFPKTAVALSIGGVPVVEFLAQEKTSYSGLVLVSCPLHLGSFGVQDNVVTDHLLAEGKSTVKTNADVLTAKGNTANVAKAMDASSVNELIEAVGTKPWGHASIDSLLRAVDPHPHLDTITKPTLMVYAMDDEAIDFTTTVDLIRLCRNPNVAVAVTESGGHCGFHTIGGGWLADVISEFASNCSRVI